MFFQNGRQLGVAFHAHIMRKVIPREAGEPDMFQRAWQLRGSLRISDAFYISAAEAIGGDFITSDRRLANAPALTVPVTLLPLI